MTKLNDIAKRMQHSLLLVFVVILLSGYMVTIWAWNAANSNIENSLKVRNNQQNIRLQDALDKRLVSYQEILRGSSALFNVSQGNVSRQEWKDFVSSYNIEKSYKGLSVVGYVPYVTRTDLNAHTDMVRASGFPDYMVNPDSDRGYFTPIIYAEPSTGRVPYGFDMSSEPSRLTAMNQARDSGNSAISNLVGLRQSDKPGLVLFYPVYKMRSETIEERRTNLLGYAYAEIRTGDLVEGILLNDNPISGKFMITEGSGGGGTVIYSSDGFVTGKPDNYKQLINVLGKSWAIETSLSRDTLSAQERDQPKIILAAGLFMATLFALFVVYVSQARSRELNYRKQLELQDAKDELLSLASHQLRTPATGVKQYVGMLLEGYAGKLPAKQRDILERAYASNDRQLEIVDQILHIARIESGRLPIEKIKMNITKLIDSVVDEQKSTIDDRQQTLTLRMPKRALYVRADGQYIRMVIENLLNNASKYTHGGGALAIELTGKKDSVLIEVSDSGVGIASNDIEKLFQKFSRIHNELSISSGGTGLGLYLAKLIVELHGGTIEVISRPRLGTTFRVTLPRIVL